MNKPTPKELREAAGISQSYASMILSEDPDPVKSRTPTRALAIFVFRRFGWKHPSIAGLTADQIDTLEQIEPWSRAEAVQDEAA